MEKETIYYTTSGEPREQITHSKTLGDGTKIILSISGVMKVGDIQIDKMTYDVLKDQIKQDVLDAEALALATHNQAIIDRDVIRQSAISKLTTGSPLTQEEAEVITS